ncbi:hypothetical protein LCGC14_0645820 [marine sediment metagenome]|uniref:Uncharacterized protein n=1 Tax=marine sediment metagenome TaxID=412755 RepID=A0A0F9R2Z2_9ZZZZ
MTQWNRCCRGHRSNCPHVKVEGREIRIRDDNNNVIVLTLDQFQDVHLKVQEIVTQRSVSRRRPTSQLEPAPLGLIP